METYLIIILLMALFFAINRIKTLWDLLESLYHAVDGRDQHRINRIMKTVKEDII